MTFLITHILILGILALSFDLQLGRTGLLNFGHAALFGVGAYTVAFHLNPPTLSFPFNVIFLPVAIFGKIPYPFAIISAIFVGMLFGCLMGITTSRMKGGTSFAFIALAIAMVLFTSFSQKPEISGGETGLHIPQPQLIQTKGIVSYLFFLILVGIIVVLFLTMVFLDLKERKRFLGFQFRRGFTLASQNKKLSAALGNTISLFALIGVLSFFGVLFVTVFFPNIRGMLDTTNMGTKKTFFFIIPNTYYLILNCFILAYLFVKRLVQSPFGRVLAAIAQNEERVEAIGYNTFAYKIAALGISGGLAALAGALFAPVIATIDPTTTLGVEVTINAMLYTIVGGMGTLLGPFLGAGIVYFSELELGEILKLLNLSPELWLVVLGIIYILIVLFFPYGIVGSIEAKAKPIKDKLRRWRIEESDYWWIGLLGAFVTLQVMLLLTTITGG